MVLGAALKVRRSGFAECVVYREGFREKLAKIELEKIAGFRICLFEDYKNKLQLAVEGEFGSTVHLRASRRHTPAPTLGCPAGRLMIGGKGTNTIASPQARGTRFCAPALPEHEFRSERSLLLLEAERT